MTAAKMLRQFDFTGMHSAMQKWIDDGFLAGASAIVMHSGAIVDEAYWGLRNREENLPMTSDTICRIYSNTKVITSVAAMTLFEAGKFELDDPIAKYLPQLRQLKVVRKGATAADDVEDLVSAPTVRQLFCHNAGFSYGWIQESVIDGALLAADVMNPNIDLATMVDRLAEVPLAYQPGARFQYSVSTDVLARLVEVWSGARFSDYLKSTILKPLGMHDTDFYVPTQKHARFAANYVPVDPMDPLKPGLNPAPDSLLGGYLEPRALESGGGGLVGTLRDYTRFIQMIIGNGAAHGVRILRPETVAMMHANQLPAGVGIQIAGWSMPDTVFGLGFAIKTKPAAGEPDIAIDEYHWGGVAGTHSWIAPRADIAAIVFTQRLPGFWHPFSHDFKRCVYEAVA
jgi:CubicO group peptidase (beta-lactamase class C family)